MEQELLNYENDLLEEVSQLTRDTGKTEREAFTEIALAKLESYGNISDPNIFTFYCTGRNGKKIALDGYCYDDTDSSLILFITDYSNDKNDMLLNSDQIQRAYTSLWNFVVSSVDGSLENYTEDLEAIRISKNISYNLKNANADSQLQRLKLFILTNRCSSIRKKSVFMKSNFIEQNDISYQIWSLERFYSNDSSGKERETITIDFKDECKLEHGISYIKADISGSNDYESYLCIIPGKTLAKLYHQYGSVLLEQNVRAYLGARTKINSGILRTIRYNPERFFIYNNGISVTGNSVTFETDEMGNKYISSITDMQIINGGQTTASLYNAYMNSGKDCLDDVFVQMKLTVIKHDEDYDDMVEHISKYSNSQTTVRPGDFFSVHPFHRKIEQLSRSTPANNQVGLLKDVYWFYERTRGQYNQQTFKASASDKKNFQDKFPKSNVIKKEELAKYYITMQKKPYIVAKGASKCLSEFAPFADNLFNSDADHTKINKEFYKRCVCYAIIFRETDKMVAHSSWYTVNGFKNVIVPYAIAKVLDSIPKNKELDYDSIWKNQTMYPALRDALNLATYEAHEFFSDIPNGGIVTEFAKKESAWQMFANSELHLPMEFYNKLDSKMSLEEKANSERKEEKVRNEINHTKEMLAFGNEYWKELLKEARAKRLISFSDDDLLSMMVNINLNDYRTKIPTDKQLARIWKIKTDLEEKGIITMPPEIE